MTAEHIKARRRNYYWRKNKGGIDAPTVLREYDEYEFRIVPNSWRDLTPYRDRRSYIDIDSPLIRALESRKTVLVDFEYQSGTRDGHPFRMLYNYFKGRGYQYRCVTVDDVDNDKFNRLLMWIEPIKPVKFKNVA